MLDLATFNRWLSYHESCYGGFVDFMVDPADRELVWRRALDGYSEAELKDASFRLRQKPEQPAGYSSHLTELQLILRSMRAIAREQEQAAYYARRCGLCEGTGRLDVVGINGCKFVTPMGFKLDRSVVACKCSLGDRFRMKEYNGVQIGFSDFDATVMEPLNVWRARNRPADPERDEAAKSTKATMAYCKAAFAKFGATPERSEA